MSSLLLNHFQRVRETRTFSLEIITLLILSFNGLLVSGSTIGFVSGDVVLGSVSSIVSMEELFGSISPSLFLSCLKSLLIPIPGIGVGIGIGQYRYELVIIGMN